jgi:hypothetical protein
VSNRITVTLPQFRRLTLSNRCLSAQMREGNKTAGTAGELLDSGYELQVDARMKAELATRDGARAGGEELKKRFPTLRVRIYDVQTKTREEKRFRLQEFDGVLIRHSKYATSRFAHEAAPALTRFAPILLSCSSSTD